MKVLLSFPWPDSSLGKVLGSSRPLGRSQVDMELLSAFGGVAVGDPKLADHRLAGTSEKVVGSCAGSWPGGFSLNNRT